MKELKSRIESSFGNGEIPSERDLVSFDGYDHLDKEDILQTFHGKTWYEFFEGFTSGQSPLVGLLDDLCVMEPRGFQYYLRAYLEYLLAEDPDEPNEDEFVHFLFFAIKEFMRIQKEEQHTRVERMPLDSFGLDLERNAEALSIDQKAALKAVAVKVLDKVSRSSAGLDDWRKDLIRDLSYIRDNT